MNSLTRWDPFREMQEMQQRLTRFFNRTPMRSGDGEEEAGIVPEWAPLVDIMEDDKEYLVKADLPELRREDVEVSVERGMLILRGERKFHEEGKGKKYHRIERGYGRFMRSFALPDETDPARVSAEFKEGVLKIHLPKREKAKTKHIEVRVA